MENRLPCKSFNGETGLCGYRDAIRPIVRWQASVIDEMGGVWADKQAFLNEGQYIPSGTEAPRPYNASDERFCAARGNTVFLMAEGCRAVTSTPFEPSPGFMCNRYIPENGREIDGNDIVKLNPLLKITLG